MDAGPDASLPLLLSLSVGAGLFPWRNPRRAPKEETRMEGFNADWMPTAYDTAAGPDDGGRHDRRDRRPGDSPMVRIIAIGAAVCAVAGVGGIILVDPDGYDA